MARPAPLQVLLLDNCMGVVAGAVLERMAGLGALCCSHVDRPYCADAVRAMNLSDAERAIMCTAPLAVLKQAKVCVYIGWLCFGLADKLATVHIMLYRVSSICFIEAAYGLAAYRRRCVR